MIPLRRTALAIGATIALTNLATAQTSTQPIEQLAPVKVEGETPLVEDAPVGPYNQPDWTTARRFTNTRVYLQQMPWDVGIEQWVKAQWPKGEAGNDLFEEEVEIGLPHRFQFDLYENWDRTTDNKVVEDSVSTELRYALADWGKIWGNPTLYGEWTFSNRLLGADRFEVKILLGDDITPRIHWGFNIIYEQELGGHETDEKSLSGGIGYTVIDQKLSIGIEMKMENETTKNNRGPAPFEIDIGPSIQWRPTANSHIDIAPLCGLTSDSPTVEAWFILGYDFGTGHSREAHEPLSTSGGR